MEKDSSVYDACFSKDWSRAIKLLNSGHSSKYIHPETKTSTLYVAIARNAPLSVLTSLIEHEADPNKSDIKGFTPLHAACEYHLSLAGIQLLLSNTKNISRLKALDGTTPLHTACKFLVTTPVLSALLKVFNINEKANNGFTPLLFALDNGADISFIKLLLKFGADRTIQFNNNENAITFAKKKCSLKIIELLQNWYPGKDDDEKEDKKIETARILFQHAVTSSSTFLVTRKSNVDDNNDNGIISVKKGDLVQLVHGSIDYGLPSPYESYVLVETMDDKRELGKCLKDSLIDPVANYH